VRAHGAMADIIEKYVGRKHHESTQEVRHNKRFFFIPPRQQLRK